MFDEQIEKIKLKRVERLGDRKEKPLSTAKKQRNLLKIIPTVIIIIIIAPFFFYFLYSLLKNLTTAPADVSLKIRRGSSSRYKPATRAMINKELKNNRKAHLMAVVRAKADYQLSLFDNKMPRNYIKLQFKDQQGQVLSDVLVRLNVKQGEKTWTGKRNFIIVANYENVKMSEYVKAVQTNEKGTADKMPVIVILKE